MKKVCDVKRNNDGGGFIFRIADSFHLALQGETTREKQTVCYVVWLNDANGTCKAFQCGGDGWKASKQ